MIKFESPLIRTFAVAAFVGSMAFAGIVHAQDADAPAAMPSAAQTTQTESTTTKTHTMMNVETRIKTLHDKLGITTAEESDWANVAATMRTNEATMDQLINERHANPDSMTAIDDLQSYQKIAQAHADGLQKMTASFSTLYNDMSDAQKQNADEVFGRFEGHRAGKGKKHSS